MNIKVGNLKSLPDWEKMVNKKIVMNSATAANMQIYVPDKDYFLESTGHAEDYKPEINKGINVFNIAIALPDLSKESIRNGFFSIVNEKLHNEFHAFEAFIQKLKEDGHLTDPEITFREFTFKEFIEWTRDKEMKCYDDGSSSHEPQTPPSTQTAENDITVATADQSPSFDPSLPLP